MQELNVIDEVVEDGLGMAATRRIIATRRRRQTLPRAIQRASNSFSQFSLQNSNQL
jgi:hypothetical protein